MADFTTQSLRDDSNNREEVAELIFQLHFDYAFRTARNSCRFSNSKINTEEVVQVVMDRLSEAIIGGDFANIKVENIETKSSRQIFQSWIFIATQYVVGELDRRQRREKAFLRRFAISRSKQLNPGRLGLLELVAHEGFEQCTSREQQVLKLKREGNTIKEISRLLGIEKATVRGYLKSGRDRINKWIKDSKA